MKSVICNFCSVTLLSIVSAIALAPQPTLANGQKVEIIPNTQKTRISQLTNPVSFESELLRLTNLERRKVGLPALRLSSQLGKAAQLHAVDMANNNYFSHTGRNGSTVGDRTKSSGYKFRAVGENLAAGKATPEGTILQWMNSSGHRANILNSQFTEIGFGYANAPSSRYRHYWVQVFGKPQQ
ncbi:CAP domain-containing protein [Pseudanabaena biceps]|nr:CAP domain-containing protein [Pseudanabaena biceps]